MKPTLLAAVFSLLGCVGANAEPWRVMNAPAGAMPAFEAVTITRSMGLDPLGGPIWRNGRYVMRALDRDGREMHVVLDARSGAVLAVRPTAARYFSPGPRDYVPRPGAAIPDAFIDDEALPGEAVDDGYDGGVPRRQMMRPDSMPRANVTGRPSDNATRPAASPIKKTPKPAQAAKAAPVPTPRHAPEKKKQEPSAQSAQAPETAKSAEPAKAGEPAKASEPAKTDIRKIEIDRKPQDEQSAPAAPPPSP